MNSDEESLLEAGVQFTFPAVSITHSYKYIYNNVCAPCMTRNITVTSAVSAASLASRNKEQIKAQCKCWFGRECPKTGVTGICHVLNDSEDAFAFFLLTFECYSQISYNHIAYACKAHIIRSCMYTQSFNFLTSLKRLLLHSWHRTQQKREDTRGDTDLVKGLLQPVCSCGITTVCWLKRLWLPLYKRFICCDCVYINTSLQVAGGKAIVR